MPNELQQIMMKGYFSSSVSMALAYEDFLKKDYILFVCLFVNLVRAFLCQIEFSLNLPQIRGFFDFQGRKLRLNFCNFKNF